MIGDYNGTLALKPDGGAKGRGWVAGVKYVVGPASIGGLFSSFDSQGDQRLVGISQRHEYVAYVAATYRLAPGLITFADYAYGQRHQGSFNFATNAVGTGAFNNVRAQGALVGMMVSW
jgi:predicted porin